MADNIDWFPLYWQRFLLGTIDMNAEQVGAYFLLLLYEWDHGYVPTDEAAIRKICRIPRKNLERVLKKFERIGDKYFNNTLEEIRREVAEKIAKRSDSGRKAAKARWEKDANAMRSESVRIAYNSTGEEKKEDNNTTVITDDDVFSLSVLENFLREEKQWHEAIAQRYAVKVEFVKRKLPDFFLHLETQGISEKSIKQAKAHYDNWFRKKLELKKKDDTRTYPNQRRIDPNEVAAGIEQLFARQRSCDNN